MKALSLVLQASRLRPTRFAEKTLKTYSLPMMRSEAMQLARLYCSYTVNHSFGFTGKNKTTVYLYSKSHQSTLRYIVTN